MSVEFSCRDVGVVCSATLKADSPDSLIEKIALHAKTAHDVEHLSETLVDYARSVVKTEKESDLTPG